LPSDSAGAELLAAKNRGDAVWSAYKRFMDEDIGLDGIAEGWQPDGIALGRVVEKIKAQANEEPPSRVLRGLSRLPDRLCFRLDLYDARVAWHEARTCAAGREREQHSMTALALIEALGVHQDRFYGDLGLFMRLDILRGSGQEQQRLALATSVRSAQTTREVARCLPMVWETLVLGSGSNVPGPGRR